jgi:hypothetical protein
VPALPVFGRAAAASPMNASTNRTRGFLPPGCRGYPITSELAANRILRELPYIQIWLAAGISVSMPPGVNSSDHHYKYQLQISNPTPKRDPFAHRSGHFMLGDLHISSPASSGGASHADGRRPHAVHIMGDGVMKSGSRKRAISRSNSCSVM